MTMPNERPIQDLVSLQRNKAFYEGATQAINTLTLALDRHLPEPQLSSYLREYQSCLVKWMLNGGKEDAPGGLRLLQEHFATAQEIAHPDTHFSAIGRIVEGISQDKQTFYSMGEGYADYPNTEQTYRGIIWVLGPNMSSAQDTVRCTLRLVGIPDPPIAKEQRLTYDPHTIFRIGYASIETALNVWSLDPAKFRPMPADKTIYDLECDRV